MLIIILFLVAVILYVALDMIKPAYGVVFDVATGEYVDTASVVLSNADSGLEIARSLTDMRGRYYFFVPPGRYKLSVERTHFSVTRPGITSPLAILYGAPYQGEVIVRNTESALSVPIALQQNAFDWNHKNKIAIRREIAGFSVVVRIATLIIAATHVIASLALFVATLSSLYGVLACMMLVWWWVFLYDHSPVNGIVNWVTSGRRDGSIHVHGYGDVLVKKIPITASGNYWALVPPGTYTMRVYEHPDTEPSDTRLVREYERVIVPTGVLNKSFLVK